MTRWALYARALRYQKAASDNAFSMLSVIQHSGGQMLKQSLDYCSWMPESGKKSYLYYTDRYIQATKQLRSIIDRGYDEAEKRLADSGSEEEQATPAAKKAVEDEKVGVKGAKIPKPAPVKDEVFEAAPAKPSTAVQTPATPASAKPSASKPKSTVKAKKEAQTTTRKKSPATPKTSSTSTNKKPAAAKTTAAKTDTESTKSATPKSGSTAKSNPPTPAKTTAKEASTSKAPTKTTTSVTTPSS